MQKKHKNKLFIFLFVILLVLFIQPTLFSQECSIYLSNNDSQFKFLNTYCGSQFCEFYMFNKNDITSPNALNDCLTTCESNYNTRDCKIECFDTHIQPSNLESAFVFNSDLVFNSLNCDNRNINIILGTHLKFEMKDNFPELGISSSSPTYFNSLNTNGHDIVVNINNNKSVSYSYFNITVNNLVISKHTTINVKSKQRNDCDLINDIGFYFKNIIVQNEDSLLDLNIITQDFDKKCGGPENNYLKGGRNGDSINVQGNSIDNNGNLNIYIKSGNAGPGKEGVRKSSDSWQDRHGIRGGIGSNVNFVLNKNLINNNNLDINIISGNGGHGGDGYLGNNTHRSGSGGNGGDGGKLSFFINEIINEKNTKLNIDLKSGDGGYGGDTGKYLDYVRVGGNGGHGGNVYLCDINSRNSFFCKTNNFVNNLTNKGSLNISIETGYGNYGGKNHLKNNNGMSGNGGNAGSIFNNITINNLLNSGNLFTFIDSGIPGLFGDCEFDECNPGSNGNFGKIKDFNINYLENFSENFEIILDGKKNTEYENNYFIINSLKTASYLPQKIHLLDRDKRNPQEVENKHIIIDNACYTKMPEDINYIASSLYLKSADNEAIEDMSYILPNLNTEINNNCSICDYLDFKDGLNNFMPQNTGNKTNQKYVLYSSVNGSIDKNDLNIYYAKNNTNFTTIFLYNPLMSNNQNLPVYTNKEIIQGNFNSDLNLYEYELNPENLEWYYNPDLNLSDKELYCLFQNYRIVGKINNKNFNFPFTPIFKK